MDKRDLTEEQIESMLRQHGPKWCHRQGVVVERTPGFTKPTLEKRREKRRLKNKLVRKSRKK